jgi:predicted AlkP superfamily phosphohydrolase/phosphomutase
LRGYLGLSLTLGLCGPYGLSGQQAVASPKVVVVSIDAGADWLVDEFLARGVLPADGAFGRMSRLGARAEAMVPINVASTSPSHIAMFTGAYPERNGIVANTFLLRGQRLPTQSASGFTTPILSETIWSAAQRQGKRVITASAVGADASSPDRAATMTLGYPVVVIRSSVVGLGPQSGAAEHREGRFEHVRDLAVGQDAPPLGYRLGSGAGVPLYARAVDRVFDRRVAYDGLELDMDQDPVNGAVGLLQAGEWLSVTLPFQDRPLHARIRLLELASDLSKAVLYLGAAGFTPGSPAAYVQELEGRLGGWPAETDNQSLNRGLITEEVWFEQAAAVAQYQKELTLANLQRDDWDLLLTYYPVIDWVAHRYLVRDPRQADYQAEGGRRPTRYARYVERAYEEVDRIVASWMDAAPPGTNFVVVSDHGMVPTHTTVLLNNVLAAAGFVVAGDGAEVKAFTDGPSAHIYVNIAGRNADGVVAPERLVEFVSRLVAVCQGVRDPATGEPVFQVVTDRTGLVELKLGHPERAGDVFVSARPGFSLSARLNPAVPSFLPSSFQSDVRAAAARNDATREFMEAGGLNEMGVAVHGHVGTSREIQAIFYAYGPRVPRRNLGLVQAVDVAPTIAALLGIAPPRGAQGRAVMERRRP